MTQSDTKELVKYWIDLSEYDIDTAKSMFDTKRYPYVLFMCHLSIEKILKAIIVKNTNIQAPYTHNLILLAEKPGIAFSKEHKNLIADLNNFNLEARYPEWKSKFYKIATKNYSEKYYKNTTSLHVWLKKFLHN